MAKLTIQRKGGFIGSAFTMTIFIDGNENGSIGRRQTKEFQLTDGHHNLKLEDGWLIKTRARVEYESSSDKIFQVGFSSVYYWGILYVIAVLALKEISFDDGTWLIPRFGGQFQLFLMLLPYILIVFYLSIANKSLVLKESNELNLSLL